MKAAEVVKFLPDVLDALFSILMENSDSELYDNLVFEVLSFFILILAGLFILCKILRWWGSGEIAAGEKDKSND